MPATTRERFLSAVAKMLGENPLGPGALDNVLVCQPWLLEEILESIFRPPEEKFELDRDKLNRLLVNCERRMVTEHFYEYFFGATNSLEEFEAAVEKFRIKAMWLYGNFQFAFKKLGTGTKEEFDAEIKKTEPRPEIEFTLREPFDDIEPIPIEDLGLLGFVSGQQKITDLDICVQTLELLSAKPTGAADVLSTIGAEKQKKISEVLDLYEIPFPAEGTDGLSLETISPKLLRARSIADSLRIRQEKAETIGLRNTHRYLTLPYLDVYVATSMRKQEDYENQHRFIKQVFDDPQVRDLQLRYFDPTRSHADNRITKGLIEMLMLRRATVTIYTASHEDTVVLPPKLDSQGLRV